MLIGTKPLEYVSLREPLIYVCLRDKTYQVWFMGRHVGLTLGAKTAVKWAGKKQFSNQIYMLVGCLPAV